MPKVDEIDFNGDSAADTTGQVEKTETKEEAPEEPKEETPEETEDVETLKERLKKAEEDKENYKKGMLKYKDLSLSSKAEESKDEEDYPDWDETSKKFQKQTLSQAEKVAEKRAREIVENYNEKSAISIFVKKHPEMAQEDNWKELVGNYNTNHPKDSVESYNRALEKAYINLRYDRGELSELESEAEKKGIKKGKAEAQIADMSSVSKTTFKTSKEGRTLSPGAIDLANKMRVDLKKLAEEDLDLPATAKF